MRSLLFWDVTQHRLVVSYRRFGTTYRSHLQGSSLTLEYGTDSCPETSVINKKSMLYNVPKEQRSANSTYHQWAAEVHTSQRSITYSNPSLLAGKFHMRGITCQWSPKWYFCQFLLMILQTFSMFHLCNLWSIDLNAHNLRLKFSHIRIKKSLQMSVFSPWYCHLKAVLSIPCISDEIFLILRQNLTQMHFSFKSEVQKIMDHTSHEQQ
jgi:hypothetical protein